ncbi:MAG: hypothetical protein ABFD10_13180 [Prolixibacteraceae bacterium]
MKEVVIKYKNPKTLEAIKALSKYLDFSVDIPKPVKREKLEYINGVPAIPGDNSIDISELTSIFTGKELNAKNLRTLGWQR